MVKKRRQNDPHQNDSSSSSSCDEKSHSQSSENKCQHIKKAVDLQKLRKTFKNLNLETANCPDCLKLEHLGLQKRETEEFEYDKTLWLCLKCGSQLCGRSRNQHALKHFNTPRSDCHALAINTTTFSIWCYSCDEEISPTIRKNLLETVDFVKKLSQKSPALTLTLSPSDEINEINNIKDNILDTIRPLINNDSTTTTTQSTTLMNCYPTNVPIASTSGPSIIGTTSTGGAIPGMARRVQQPAIIATTQSSLISLPPVFDQPLPRVRGLTNLGNTCFFNAVLQCLAQTPYLLEILMEASEPGEEFTLPGGNFVFKDGKETFLPPVKGKLKEWGGLTSALAEALEELQTEGCVFRPTKLFDKLTTKCPQFRGGDQHDSHELLRHLLESVRSEDLQRYQKVILQHLNYKQGQDINSVGEEMKQKCKIYGQQAADRILRPEQVFRGFLVSTLACQDCYHTSSRHESFLDMSLPVSVEKPQPSTRRKTSPEASPSQTLTSPNAVSKHQLKKEKEKKRKAKAASNKTTAQNFTLIMGPAGDNAIAVPSSSSGATCNRNDNSNSSSGEQSDADVEDNLIDDSATAAPKRADRMSKSSSLPELFYDSNGNNEMSTSLVDPEKRGDSPENRNKDSNDENDSGIATSPANTNGGTSVLTNIARGGSIDDIGDNMPNTNLVLALGISEKGASLVRQNTSDKLKMNGGAVDGNSLNYELEKLSLKEREILEAKKKAKQKRMRTQSHSDWCTTIAPRYHCEDGECSIQSCLNNFTAVELMTGNNKVGCDGCTQRINGEDGKTIYTNATKQFLISSPPAVLILHLKRFQVGPRCMFRKLPRAVSFPMVLDIAPFCGSKVKNLPNIDRKQKKLLYALYGIVEHSGGMYGGHYTAYVKVRAKLPANDKRWKFMPQGSKAELDQTDEQKAKLDELLAKEKAREQRMKANDSDDYSSSNSSSELDDGSNNTTNVSNSADEALEGAVGGAADASLTDESKIEAPDGKWYYVSDSRVNEVTEDTVLRAQAYLLFYERIY